MNSIGIHVWWDRWEILPGESIVQKIFSNGLDGCDIFLILLSNASVKSKWVNEELDTAIIKKIEGSTKIIPAFLHECEVPLPLRTLLSINFYPSFELGLKNLEKAIFGVTDKPIPGAIPDEISALKSFKVPGLSPAAAAIGSRMALTEDKKTEESVYSSTDLAKYFPTLSPSEINDAIEELEEESLIKVTGYLGMNSGYAFHDVEPLFGLFLKFASYLSYNPELDIRLTAATVTRHQSILNRKLHEETGIPIARLNRAAAYLQVCGLIEVSAFIGTHPFTFYTLSSNRKTREFVKANSD